MPKGGRERKKERTNKRKNERTNERAHRHSIGVLGEDVLRFQEPLLCHISTWIRNKGWKKGKKKSQGIEHARKILKLGKFEEIDEELEGSGGHTEGELLLEGKHLPHPAADSRGREEEEEEEERDEGFGVICGSGESKRRR